MLRRSGWIICLLWLTTTPVAAQQLHLANTEVRALTGGSGLHSVTVQLPASYYQSSHFGHRYPVFYLPGGAEDLLLVSAATHLAMQTGKLPQAILVSFSLASNDNQPNEDRQSHVLRHDQLLALLERRVIPFIERSYRADPVRRTFIGRGKTAHLGAYTLLRTPGLFQAYLLASPDLWYQDGFLLDRVRGWSEQQSDLNARVFIGVGSLESPLYQSDEHDRVGDAIAFRTQLAAWRYPGFDVKLSLFDDTIHEAAWPVSVIQGLLWLFGAESQDNQ